jgi:hypothetical protein
MNPVPVLVSGLIIVAIAAAAITLAMVWPDWIGCIPH